MQGILAVLLPAENLRDPCLRTLVADVLADLILGQAISRRACAPWVLWQGIASVAERARGKVEPAASGRDIKERTKSRLWRFSLTSPARASYEHRGTALQAGASKAVGAETPNIPKPSAGADGQLRSSFVAEVFWRMLQYLYLAAAATRFVLEGLVAAAAAPPYGGRPPKVERGETPTEGRSSMLPTSSSPRRPILTYAVFGLGSQLLELSERMPWTTGLIALGRHHLVSGALRLGAREGLLDK